MWRRIETVGTQSPSLSFHDCVAVKEDVGDDDDAAVTDAAVMKRGILSSLWQAETSGGPAAGGDDVDRRWSDRLLAIVGCNEKDGN
jgi:hypothetical protein